MFFGRRKKIVRPFADRDEGSADMDKFQEQLKEVAYTADVVDRLVKLEKIKSGIQSELDNKRSDIADRAGDRGVLAFLGGNIAAFSAVTGVAIATGVGSVVVLLAPAVIGAGYVATKYQETTKKRLEEEDSGFFNLLESRKTLVSELEDKLLNEQLEAIARSPGCEGLFEEYPDVKSRFAAAAAKKIVSSEKSFPKPADDDRPKF